MRSFPLTGPEPSVPHTATATSLADVVDAMTARFSAEISTATITRVVRQCHREHEIAHPGVAPLDAVKRLACARLTDLATHRPSAMPSRAPALR